MDKQAIFNKVWNHFIVNKGQPGFVPVDGSGGGFCVYGKPGDAARCAIGIFDTDGVLAGLKNDFYGVVSIRTDLREAILKMFNSDEKQLDVNWLVELQKTHDTAAMSKDGGTGDALSAFHRFMYDGMTSFALKYNLSIPTA